MNTKQTLINLVKANVKIIQVISYETLLIHANLVSTARDLSRNLYLWNRVDGIKKWHDDKSTFVTEDEDIRTAEKIFDFFNKENNIILLLEDFHPDLDNGHKAIKYLRNVAMDNNKFKRTLILSQPFRFLPRELEKEVHVMELPYPSFNDLEAILQKVCEIHKVTIPQNPSKLIEAALGLTIIEAEKAFSLAYIETLAYIENGRLTDTEIPLIIREKESVIKKSGYLEYFHPKESMADVGGLDNLKDWLHKRGRAFDKGAADFGLDYPRGILLLGIPGTGKSLTAKAIGNHWQFPLLRLDMGKIFGGIVGESEKNIAGALHIAEAIAPSILWIDEIEKAMSGAASSGQTDGGTTSRVLGTFLTWLQEKKKPVFVVATANDISKLPPELLRKGRVDEIFFVDLPTQEEREQILTIHLKKKGRTPSDFDITKLAKESKGFSGAELEEVVKEALFQAFDYGRQLEDEDLFNALSKTYPLAKTMAEVIGEMRKWAKSRAVNASSTEPELFDDWKDDDTPKLQQESYNNPFIEKSSKSKS